MATVQIDLSDPRIAVNDGDIIEVVGGKAVYIMVGSVSANITLSVDIIGNGNYRDISPMIHANKIMVTPVKYPVGSKIKITGGSAEIWIYAD